MLALQITVGTSLITFFSFLENGAFPHLELFIPTIFEKPDFYLNVRNCPSKSLSAPLHPGRSKSDRLRGGRPCNVDFYLFIYMLCRQHGVQ